MPNSSFAEVRMGLLIEPTHMEDEDEEQENEKEEERDGEECRVEGRRVFISDTQHARHAHAQVSHVSPHGLCTAVFFKRP